MGTSTAEEVRQMVIKTANTGQSLLATIIGIVVLLVGATGVFAQLQKSLNIIWEVKADPKKENFLHTLRIRLFSFGLIVSIGFLLLISLVATSIMTAVGEHLKAAIPEVMMAVFYIVNVVVSFILIAVLFALMFKVLPDVDLEWRSVRVGALMTAVLFLIGKFALAIYFGTTDQISVYGPAGSVVLLLLWVSYSSMIVFFGAEFTKVYTNRFYGGATPNEIAQKKPGREH
jgi:membrane protein